jgi:hypothetical protein
VTTTPTPQNSLNFLTSSGSVGFEIKYSKAALKIEDLRFIFNYPYCYNNYLLIVIHWRDFFSQHFQPKSLNDFRIATLVLYLSDTKELPLISQNFHLVLGMFCP